MKINIWIPRENVFSLNAWLKTPLSDSEVRIISFYHSKHDKRMDLVQVSISIDEYQKIIDSNEAVQSNIAEQVGWITNTTIDNYDESQLQMLFRD
jgi:ACT domain-containing protein|tara:strand:- start:41 stop:325 length:285 start_codon:yes stop_codon:yes gene_type:complete